MRQVTGYCGFCGVHCPTVTTVDGHRVISVEPDRSHPFGGAICAKGRAAPEFHEHGHRVDFPMRRTRPKTDPDPGWERCSWDEALDLIARKLLEVRASSGPEAVAFNKGTTGGTGLTDTERWLHRLLHLFGTPNLGGTTHLCQWPRDTGAAHYTFGTPSLAMPDVPRSRCIVLWGASPTGNFLTLGIDITAAKARGAKLLVIDPRRAGLANKADLWLQVRPGTDGALALGLIHLLIQDHRFDEPFVRDWTNAPLLVRDDTGELLTSRDLTGVPVVPLRYLAAVDGRDDLVFYDPSRGTYAADAPFALRGTCRAWLADGRAVTCRPVFERLASIAAAYPPAVVARITGVPEEKVVAAARLLADHRPVSHYFHNGLVQHTNATQASRAIEILYALLGDFDSPGGNVPGIAPKVNDVAAREALPAEMAARRLGRAERPIGPPATPGTVTAYDMYRAILEGQPYPLRALVSFGANMLLANGDTLRGRAALERLEFFAQIELVHTPTSRFADVLLPASSWMESSALKVGHRYPIETMAHIQFREAAVPPLHERRSDVEIVFGLAQRLGFGAEFWDGDIDAAYRHAAGAEWRDPRRAAGAAPRHVGSPRAAAAPPVRRGRPRDGRPARLRDADEEGGAVRPALRRARPAAAARLRRARAQPGEPARAGPRLPAGADERQARAVRPQPASRAAQPPQDRAEPDGRAPSGDRRPLRGEDRRVAPGRDAGGPHPRAGARHRRRHARRRLLLARLVGGVPGARPPGLRSVLGRGRQPESLGAERPARPGERRHAAPVDLVSAGQDVAGTLAALGRPEDTEGLASAPGVLWDGLQALEDEVAR